jgi:hypothetical protein
MIMQREIAGFCRNKIPCQTQWMVGGSLHTACLTHGPVPIAIYYEEVLDPVSNKPFFAKFYACPKCLELENGPIMDADVVNICELCNFPESEVGGLNSCKHCKAMACKGCMNDGSCSDCEDYGVFVC